MATFKRDFTFISEEEMKENISKNIRKYRKLAGITQEQLAVDIDKSYDYVRKLEYKKGKISCKKYTLYKIAKVLHTPIDKFFE